MVLTLRDLALGLAGDLETKPRQLLADDFELHQEIAGLRAAGAELELTRRESLENKDAARHQPPQASLVKSSANHRRQVAEDGDDALPCARLNRVFFEIGVDRLDGDSVIAASASAFARPTAEVSTAVTS